MMRLQSNSFRMICEPSPDPVWVVDAESRFLLEANEAARLKFGYAREEFLSLKLADLFPREDSSRVPDMLCSAQAQGRIPSLQQSAKNGRTLEMDLIYRPLEFNGRKALICVACESDEQKRLAADLADVREQLAALVSRLPAVIFELDREGRISLLEGRGSALIPSGTSALEAYAHNSAIVANIRRALSGEEFTAVVREKGRVHETRYVPRREGGALSGVVGLDIDITERVEAEEALREHLSAMEASLDAIAMGGPDQALSFVNDAFLGLFGFSSREECIGKPWDILFDEPERGRMLGLASRARDLEGVWRGEAFCRGRGGGRIPVEITLTRLSNGGFIAVARDVSPRRRLEERVRARIEEEASARSAFEGSCRDKDEFLAEISSGLGDLSARALSWAKLLDSCGPGTPLAAQAAEALWAPLGALSRAADDLLDYAQLASGRMKLGKRLLDLRPAIEDAARDLRSEASRGGVSLAVEVDDSCGPVFSDPDRLRQIVRCLGLRALRPGRPGAVLRLTAKRAGALAEIRVSLSPPAGSSPECLLGGLEVRVARELSRALGGALEEEAGGGVWALRLPVPAKTKEARREASVPGAMERLDGTRALVVDHDPDHLALACAALRNCGAEVREAGSVAQGLRAIRECPPHVVLAAYPMPGEDCLLLAAEGGPPAALMSGDGSGPEGLLDLRRPADPGELAAAVAALRPRG
jgi:PAS domain S-box-containing protein